MKLSVKVTPIFVIVVLVFVVYSIFLFMNRGSTYEPLDNPPSCLGPVENETPPSCGTSAGSNTGSDVPGCYSTVRGDAYNGFMSDFMSSDYILKTQMVTPVCPNNPVGEVGTEYGKEDRIVTPKDDKGKKDVTKAEAAKTDYDPKMVKPDETKKTPSFLTEGTDKAQGPAQGGSQGGTQGSDKNGDMTNTYLLNAPKTTIKPEPFSGSCPPCPACQRCPEPVVECKRVVNYNAAGASNLPVPMIADFSKF